MGKQGLAAFLSEPRFEGLPATLETPGPEKKGSDKQGSHRGQAPAASDQALEAARARPIPPQATRTGPRPALALPP